MYIATVITMRTGDIKPIIATSTASKLDEMHSGTNKL